ncbi:alkaline phosphatase D [Haloactinopolyspora alba]|uniref:Alkaline phosphatase D n=1 Tax=Haloactinopolyspora alba TaxID=648780 RepID=A0A2P8DWG8_9ACTN|nr:alkaline phosphatase D family protein [Haloactinopolyspora alba]PSL01544.1 alkaline phosphatase D [Haloactinopolyspora alba]
MAPTDTPPPTFDRRTFLRLSGVSSAALALGVAASDADAAATPGGPVPDGVFGLGIASGDPGPGSVVLWTRLAPEPLAADGHGGMPLRPVPVRWEVSPDERFRVVARRGTAIASPELAHAVHPLVEGLEPGREYFYRFRVGREVSPVGRTKTLPAAGASTSSFSFATASCQAWYHGHFSAYRHLANEELDAVFFLGDYIYEYGIGESNLWRAGASVAPEHGAEIETLEQFRLRYALFKTDPHLQALHATAPWMVTWDDHEVQNNYGADGSRYGISTEHFPHLRAVAYRAFYENLPLSLSTMPDGPDSTVFRRFDVGSLARFNVLDTRQFRDAPPVDREDQYDERRSMLGRQQERWLYEGMSGSPATWNVAANGVTVSAITEDRTDQWDGYPAARARLIEAMRTTSNPVVLTGDIHRHVASELKADFADPDSPTVGVELICTSVASGGDGAPTDGYTPDWVQHPYVKLYDGRRGYVHCRMTPDELTSRFRIVPWIEADADAPVRTTARFVTPAGAPGLEGQE